MQVQITTPIHGAILNRHDGRQDDGGLRITVRGVVSGADTVTVRGAGGAQSGAGGSQGGADGSQSNGGDAGAGGVQNGGGELQRGAVRSHGVAGDGGIQAAIVGATFAADVTLTAHETTLTAVAERGGETATHAVTVLWDQRSFPRYRFSLDDDVYFLRDLAFERPKSIFDNFYLGFMRDLRDRYGTKTHINIYYACEDFDLRQMPDTYKSEWRDNAGWLQLSFHARADQPRDPYKEASAEKLLTDYRQVRDETLRFAGEEAWSHFTTLHWGEGTRLGCRALRQEGIWGLAGYFVFDPLPRVNYYLDAATTAYLNTHDYWKDYSEDLLFVTHDQVINSHKTPEEVVAHLDTVGQDPHRGEVLELMVHEQYFRTHLPHYQPNVPAKTEAAIRWATEHGYRSVLYDEGFLGA